MTIMYVYGYIYIYIYTNTALDHVAVYVYIFMRPTKNMIFMCGNAAIEPLQAKSYMFMHAYVCILKGAGFCMLSPPMLYCL